MVNLPSASNLSLSIIIAPASGKAGGSGLVKSLVSQATAIASTLAAVTMSMPELVKESKVAPLTILS